MFEAQIIESSHCCHASVAVGDFDADGDVDIATGSYTMAIGGWDDRPVWIEIWENLSR